MASLTVSSADAATPNQVDFVPPAITSAASAGFAVGRPGTFTVTAGGTPTPSISDTGSLPATVGLHDNGDGSATLSGTPAPGTAGSYPLSIAAVNGHQPDGSQAFTLIVEQPLAFAGSATSAAFTVAQRGSFTVTVTGYPVPAISAAGSLPAGLHLDDNGDGTAALSGTPAAGSGGIYTLTLTAANGSSPDATRRLTVTVDQAPAITSVASTAFTVGSAAEFTVTTTGYPLPAISAAGALPRGVRMHDNGDGTATVSGTSAPGSGGAYRLTLTAANGISRDATQALSLFVSAAPVPEITIQRPSDGARYAYGKRVVAKYSADDPGGIAKLTGTVPSGQPIDTAQPGRHTFAVTATARNGLRSTATVSYTVAPPENRFTVSKIRMHGDGTVTLELSVPGAGRIDVLETAWDDNLASSERAAAVSVLEPAARRFAFARARHQARRAGRLSLRITPNAKGRRLVHAHRYRVTLRLWVTFTPAGGQQRSEGVYGIVVRTARGNR